MIGTLKRQHQAWAEAHREYLGLVETEDGPAVGIVKADSERFGRISITIGEIAYNLRAGLDYIVYDLARMEQGKIVTGTQFPIEDTQKGFLSRVTGKRDGNSVPHFLKGVPKTSIPMFAKLQPYAGCTWTRELRELTNPDKHRHLSSLRSNFRGRLKEPPVIVNDPEAGPSISMRMDMEVEVLFPDGRPVQETLEELCGRVAETVALFKGGIASKPRPA